MKHSIYKNDIRTIFHRMIVSAFIFLGNMNAIAQESCDESYHLFLKEGKTWNYEDRYFDFETKEEWTKDVSYVINGTTEIDGKMYYKMYRVSEDGNEYYCALREQDRKVWAYSSDDGDELLYDFNMSVGDSYMPIDEWKIFTLTAITPIQVNEVLLKVFQYDVRIEYFPDFVDVTPYSIVEGVGCEEGWSLVRLFWQYPKDGIVHKENFLSCYEDGQCIFTVEDFNRTGTSIQHSQVKDANAEGNSTYYSLSGQRLPTLKHGVYIVRMTDGKTKKVVIK